jgi:hypothetical protein
MQGTIPATIGSYKLKHTTDSSKDIDDFILQYWLEELLSSGQSLRFEGGVGVPDMLVEFNGVIEYKNGVPTSFCNIRIIYDDSDAAIAASSYSYPLQLLSNTVYAGMATPMTNIFVALIDGTLRTRWDPSKETVEMATLGPAIIEAAKAGDALAQEIKVGQLSSDAYFFSLG